MGKYPANPENMRRLLGLIDGCLTTLRAEVDLSEKDAETLGDAIAALVNLRAEFELSALAKIEPDEPYFTVRGRDVLFPGIVLSYAHKQFALTEDEDVKRELYELAIDSLTWQAVHEVKVAD